MTNGDEQIAEAVLKTDQWCDDACEKWYGADRKTPPHFGEVITSYRRGEEGAVEKMLRLASESDENAPAIARASALKRIGGKWRRECLQDGCRNFEESRGTPHRSRCGDQCVHVGASQRDATSVDAVVA